MTALTDDQREAIAPRDGHLLDGVRRTVHRAAEMLRTGALPPAPDPARCGRCDFRAICTAGDEVASAGEP